MAGRRPRSELAVSLFPFLSILACVIGTLTLLIAALAVGQMASSSQASAAAEPETPISTIVERIAGHSLELSRVLDEYNRLERMRGRLEGLGLDPLASPAALERQLQERARMVELTSRNEANNSEIEEIRGALRVLEAELENVSELPGNTPIAILPSGFGDQLAPYFVEVRAEGLRIRKRSGVWSENMNLSDLHQRGRFKVFLENVRARGTATAIFLVRPSGVDNFRRAERMAEQNYVRFGKLAIPGEGVIDFMAIEGPTKPRDST